MARYWIERENGKCSGVATLMNPTQRLPAIPGKKELRAKAANLVAKQVDSYYLGRKIAIANCHKSSTPFCSYKISGKTDRKDYKDKGYKIVTLFSVEYEIPDPRSRHVYPTNSMSH